MKSACFVDPGLSARITPVYGGPARPLLSPRLSADLAPFAATIQAWTAKEESATRR
ncbi:hypothetical protein DF3PA_80070 [Candidatus Defluviicoccus seviourii]|uniref:Uncharacterized protein n=2 Tax=root TaxID=1 RepID=A0A564WHF1_9PROT|nr:hypothetical protein DF3PB_260009 [uncultured Defluviicoccus sp.]VUX47910.1 hypothetical protein DF3PA_80070 [Candidatus Defluviicoccus seviourii]